VALNDQQNPNRSIGGLSLAVLCKADYLLPSAQRLFRGDCGSLLSVASLPFGVPALCRL
jgi:hypothetical protein